MNFKHRIIAGLLAVSVIFGGGFITGRSTAPVATHTQIQIPVGVDGKEIDPHDLIETVATPYHSGLAAYLKLLDRTQQSVYVAIYGFTEPEVGDKLIALHKDGKTVKVLADRSQAKGRYGKELILRLRAAGIEVIIGTAGSGIMHNKFTIVDGIWVYDGSWNISKSADKQANLLNFYRSRKRADYLMGIWSRLHERMSQQDQTLIPSG